MTDPRTQDDSLDLLPSSPVVAAVAAALRAYYGDGPYHVVPVGGAAYAAIAAARPHLEEPLSAELEQIRAERDDAYGRGRDDEADGAPMRYPSTRRRVPTQAERIADAIADGHHRITEDEQMTDRYGETLDLIAAAVETATDDTLRGSIRSMIRRVRPEAFDLWSPTPARRPTTTEGTDHCPATRQTGIAGMPETLTCNRGAGHDGQTTHRDPVYGYWTHPADSLARRLTTTEETA